MSRSSQSRVGRGTAAGGQWRTTPRDDDVDLDTTIDSDVDYDTDLDWDGLRAVCAAQVRRDTGSFDPDLVEELTQDAAVAVLTEHRSGTPVTRLGGFVAQLSRNQRYHAALRGRSRTHAWAEHQYRLRMEKPDADRDRIVAEIEDQAEQPLPAHWWADTGMTTDPGPVPETTVPDTPDVAALDPDDPVDSWVASRELSRRELRQLAADLEQDTVLADRPWPLTAKQTRQASWMLMARRYPGLPVPVRNILPMQSRTQATTKQIRDRVASAGGVRAATVADPDAVYAPFGPVDLDQRSAIGDLFDKHPEYADGLWDAAVSWATRSPALDDVERALEGLGQTGTPSNDSSPPDTPDVN